WRCGSVETTGTRRGTRPRSRRAIRGARGEPEPRRSPELPRLASQISRSHRCRPRGTPVVPDRDTTGSTVSPSIVPLPAARALPRSFASLRDAVRADVGRAIAMAAGGAAAFAVVEYWLTVLTYAGAPRLTSRLGLIALTAT